MEDVCKQEITICVRGNQVMWIQTESGKHYEAYGDYVVKGKWYPADNQTIWTPLECNKKYCDNCHYQKSYKDALLVNKRAFVAALAAWLVPIVGSMIYIAMKVL